MPSGRGIRTDGYGYTGYATSVNYDSLLTKLIVSSRINDYPALLTKGYRTLCATRIAGVKTNIPLLRALLRRPELADERLHTRFLEQEWSSLYLEALVEGGA